MKLIGWYGQVRSIRSFNSCTEGVSVSKRKHKLSIISVFKEDEFENILCNLWSPLFDARSDNGVGYVHGI